MTSLLNIVYKLQYNSTATEYFGSVILYLLINMKSTNEVIKQTAGKTTFSRETPSSKIYLCYCNLIPHAYKKNLMRNF